MKMMMRKKNWIIKKNKIIYNNKKMKKMKKLTNQASNTIWIRKYMKQMLINNKIHKE